MEDDDAARAMYAAALSQEGFQVRTAPDGMAALRTIEAFEPDIVILDLRLPLADGFEVMRELRGDGAHSRVPVIAVSGHENGLQRARHDPDFFAALPKPLDPDELIGVTRRAALRVFRADSV